MAVVGQTMKLEELESDTGNISPAELDRLRSLLPENWRQNTHSGNTQLEVIIEAIEYIKMLQSKLQ